MKVGIFTALLWPAIVCFLNIGHVQSKQIPQIRLQQLDERLPKFENLALHGGDDVPKILVTFPNGATDQLILWHHRFNDGNAALPKGTGKNSYSKSFKSSQSELQKGVSML